VSTRLLPCAVLAVAGCHAGVSYSSQWASVQAKNAVEISYGDSDMYKKYDGSVRMNVITISDDTGWLRAAGMAAGSAVEESSRRDAEAASNGGYYHKQDIAVPAVVPGGQTRIAFAWGESDSWKQRYVGWTDSISPRPISGGPFFWSFEGHVLLGTIQHMDWEDSDFLFRAMIGPLFGRQIGAVGPLDVSARVGFLIDPIFKPCAALAIGSGIPYLDMTAYAQLDAIAAGHVNIGARVAYDRGQTLTPSNATSATVTAGVIF
jgi:hypothetical protein